MREDQNKSISPDDYIFIDNLFAIKANVKDLGALPKSPN